MAESGVWIWQFGPRLEGAWSPVIAVMNCAVSVAMVGIVAGGRIPLGPPIGIKGLARTPVVSHERPRRIVGASAGRAAHTGRGEANGRHDGCGSQTHACVHGKTVPEWLCRGT